MTKRTTFPLVAHVLVRDQQRILLIERTGTGFADGWFSLPGGHLDGQETPQEAARRELHEEVGLTTHTDQLQPFCVLPYRTRRGAGCNFIFRCDQWTGAPQNLEPGLAARVAWFPIGELPERTVPFVAASLRAAADGLWYREVISTPAPAGDTP